jgi:tubulin epsilon
MPRELITIQVGQCGNQIGMRFWDLALREYAAYNKAGTYDAALSSFFKNVDIRETDPISLEVGQPISCLKARAVVVDMEEGVINSMMKSSLRSIFDSQTFISDVSGAGNNWAHGYFEYGGKYGEEITEKIRWVVEECDSLQSFLMLHSMGGGTGSGLGTYILRLLEDNYSDIFRFSTVVFPEDDVVTGPYNTVLALQQLKEHSDCTLPVDNRSLIDIIGKIGKAKKARGDIADTKNDKTKAYDQMNSIVAHLLNNLTCSMRFEGSLNVDLNEITMNLVPFPRMPFLCSSLSPLYSVLDVKKEARRLDLMFDDVLSKDFQLLQVDPKRTGTYLACGLILRGQALISDLNRNVSRVKPEMRMAHWNQDGFKIGLCSQPPVGFPYSLLCLANSSAIKSPLKELRRQFLKLYKRRAHTHHYTDYMQISQFDDALEALEGVIADYASVEQPQSVTSQPSR